MAKRITAIHLDASNKNHPSGILEVQLEDYTKKSRSEVVREIDAGTVYYYTFGGFNKADVETVHPNSGIAYIRTKADNTTKDNLLSLPHY